MSSDMKKGSVGLSFDGDVCENYPVEE